MMIGCTYPEATKPQIPSTQNASITTPGTISVWMRKLLFVLIDTLACGKPQHPGELFNLKIDERLHILLQKTSQVVLQIQGRDPVHHGPDGQRQVRDEGCIRHSLFPQFLVLRI